MSHHEQFPSPKEIKTKSDKMYYPRSTSKRNNRCLLRLLKLGEWPKMGDAGKFLTEIERYISIRARPLKIVQNNGGHLSKHGP